MANAVDQMAAWMDAPTLVLLSESDDYWAQLSRLVSSSRIRGPQIHDARIAALCLHHGVDRLWTADRDFGRFPDLRTENPLVN
jgi:predicted nucleic acid-binding protein